MRPAEFFVEETVSDPIPDPWSFAPDTIHRFNLEMVQQLRRGPLDGHDDVAAAIALV